MAARAELVGVVTTVSAPGTRPPSVSSITRQPIRTGRSRASTDGVPVDGDTYPAGGRARLSWFAATRVIFLGRALGLLTG